ncbi:MAG: argininosuccinate synthase [Omnitrophica WOR_2 bacterium GWF2_38_59]|nr:MAG: argininosuccinate synthase [Omnitrophica WOR_2 bacterium GWF2_38_59]OGX49302.1 MAG: argininosuccinate synthase [Omnitrophica WOR_2 bacterium RIFOXYA2_FULL_38_17]OGX51469.1 MAG: argininosuccinate synthase [Omnitrophica WOR_2 bacterium RIFOXYA12_FULL_38_10]OGX58226.1 MAG: argininosuccinate synthase [Omnitrophica WOR_2 bacterium RIFOXYB2_FULL_38_16]HBG61877.1 argininosuccinate synthase [Candidatus Omnitrophota bacterium]
MKKVVLAYSGGLDTSCIIPWLKDKGFNTIAFCADVGQGDDFDAIKKKAIKSGASKVYCFNLQKELIEDYAFKALKAGALYEGKYNLACALSRPLIAKKQVEIALKENADALCHGCTGKGNDQVRFETTFRLMAPKLEIIAPVRTWEFKSRDEEIDYAKKKGIPVNVTKKSPYSIDTNIYGRAIECGVLENPWCEPPKSIYLLSQDPEKAPNKPTYVEIDFLKGLPNKINGKAYKPIELIKKLNDIAGKNGIGRTDMIENRLVGIKSREIYENPAGEVLFKALNDLESLVMDRETMRHKTQASQKYAELTYNGLWFTPLKEQLDVYFDKIHEHTTGTVRLKLYKGTCSVVGRKSKFSLYKEKLATYGKGDQFDQKLAAGFNALWAMPFMK